MLEQQETSAFARRIAKFLERVEYRRADSPRDKESIYRLRYEAYSREGNIEPNDSGIFTDPDDDCPNAWLIAVYIDGVLASSIRFHIASKPEHKLPVAESFADIIEPRLTSGQVILDATRQCSRLEFTRAYPFLPYITMRAAFVAEGYFNIDFITATCRPEYEPAFRRMYGAAMWSPPRPYPPLTRLHALMAYDCKAMWRTTRARYPFVRSSATEELTLYGRSSNGSNDLHEEQLGGQDVHPAGSKHNSVTYAA